MAILFGTQSNGETLPVLVDQFGNLLAKGIDGEPGAPGAPGPPGEPGPPGGSFALPPDPYEGAFLGWLNNGLAWLGTPPVPVPDDVFGPISSWDAAGILTVEGEIPQQIATGVYVYQCNADGTIFVEGWNNSNDWNSFLTSSYPLTNPGNAFDGNPESNCTLPSGGFQFIQFAPTNPISAGGSIECSGNVVGAEWVLNLGTPLEQVVGTQNSYDYVTLATGSQTIETITLRTAANQQGLNWNAIKVDGQVLVNSGEYPSAPNLNLLVQSLEGQTLIGTPNRTDNFTPGKYLRVPEQNVARWLYDGNLNKVITSTGIDISRLDAN